MSEKERIFERIREALRVAAPFPGSAHNGEQAQAAARTTTRDFRSVLPVSGATFEERLQLFRKNALDLKADFHELQTAAGAADLLQELCKKEQWTKLALHKGKLIERVCGTLALPKVHTDVAYDVRELESCSVGVTECDALVAQTGSVLVTGRSAGGRALSVLPPHHVVLASKAQLVSDLPEALTLLRQKYAPKYPSFVSFITGPSRTGDIERVLVLGAHGPRKLTIILLEES